jgi:transcription elongation factor SPT5
MPEIERRDGTVTHFFNNGDNVKICAGELENLQGKIVSIDGNVIMVMPKHEILKDVLEFQASELEKYFKPGDHVKVKYNFIHN